MSKLTHHLLLLSLVLATLGQSCLNSQDSSLLLQTGRIQVTNPAANLVAGRLRSYPVAINYLVPASGFQVAASISNLVLTSVWNNSYDFSVRGGKGSTANIAEIQVFMNEDSTWTSLQVSYLISSRSDLFSGSFIADGYIFQSTANNTITLTFGIPGWTSSNSQVTSVTEFAGLRTFLQQPLQLSFVSTTTNSQTGVLTVTISTNTPFQMLYLTYYWWTHGSADIVLANFNLNDGSIVAYPFVGLEAISANKQTYSGTGFNRVGVIACNGDRCPSACIKSTFCQSLKGVIAGPSCFLCGPNQVYANGNCVNSFVCGPNQIFNGTACLCVQGYLMVSGACYAACGTNSYITSNGNCQCLPNMPCTQINNCPNNQVLSGTKCVCAVGFASINGVCVAAFICPPNTVWNAATQSCICADPAQFLLNGACVSCIANSAWNGTNCVCNSGYYLISGACTTCQLNSVWNGNSCVCVQGYFLIGGVCSQCQPNSSWNGNSCVCNAGFNLINGTCATCPTMSVWVDSQKSCVCLSGYFMFNNICSTCPANSGWNGSACVCLSGFVMINNVCSQCPANTINTGSSCICSAGFFNISGVCTQAPVNAVYNGTGFVCAPTFGLLNGVCSKCPARSTIQNNSCVCNRNLRLINGKCEACPAKSRLNGTECICNNGLYLIDGNCSTCPNGSAWDGSSCACINGFYPSGSSCLSCGQNSFWNGQSCICEANFYLINGVCQACPANNVWSGVSCVCAVGFNLINGICQTCPANTNWNGSACVCNAGLNLINGVCQACPANNVWNGSACVCAAGFNLINGICQACPANNEWNGSACVCASGFYLINGLCQTCPANTNWNGSACNPICMSKSQWNGTSCVCISGFYLIQNSCLPCDPNSVYNSATQTCDCKAGYFGNYQLCTACDSSCATCSQAGSSSCTSCPAGVTLNSGMCLTSCGSGKVLISGKCFACPTNCLSCSDPNTCTQCAVNYSLTQQVVNGVSTLGCSLPTMTTPTVPVAQSKLSLTGTVVGNNVIYQGLTLSTLPAYFLTTNCQDCTDLFTVLMIPNNLGVSYSIQYVLNSQYWFVIVFNYGSSGITPTFEFKVQLNFKYANYFTIVDMAQSVTGSIKSTIYPSNINATTVISLPPPTTFTSTTSPTNNTKAPTKAQTSSTSSTKEPTKPAISAGSLTTATNTATISVPTRQVVSGGIISNIPINTISSLFP